MSKISTLPVRAVAARVVMHVIHKGQSLDQALLQAHQYLNNPGDAPLLQEMAYGCCRWFFQLQAEMEQLLNKPLKSRDKDIECLLMVGLYQLQHMHIAAHAVIHETVESVRALDKVWAKGLVNAILRHAQRADEAQRASWIKTDVARLAHPAWLIEQLRKDWPEVAEQIMTANNQRPPMTLRVNIAENSRDDILEQLHQRSIAASPHPVVETAVVLEKAVSVGELPGFDQGYLSVQDGAAQLAAPLLQIDQGMRVLDACAAPGGKTMHILENCSALEALHAVDVDARRLQQVEENLARLGQSATLLVGDAAQPSDWWDGQPYDRILLDVPCSATGVIRRHPDIKQHRKASDISHLVKKQAAILDAIWPLLAPGGMLVYSTCSVLRKENALQLQSFLQRQQDAVVDEIEAVWGMADHPGRQIVTGEYGLDGFFYARLIKNKQ